MPLLFLNSMLPFEIREINFIDPFCKRTKRIGAKYIITTLEHLKKWGESQPIESCTKE